MQQLITPNGNLKFTLEDAEDREMVQDLLERCGGDDVHLLSELLEATGWQPNGRLAQVYPEQVGALTDAPMLSDEVVRGDDGTVTQVGVVWWYPNYMVSHFGEALLAAGSVIFQREPQQLH